MITTICYIDPASTALIWQVLAGIFISLGVVFGVFWKKITTFFKSLWVKLFRKNKNNEAEKVVDESILELEDETTESSENSENTESKVESTIDEETKEIVEEKNIEEEKK